MVSQNEVERSAEKVSSTFSSNSVLVKTLFDSGATYKFVSSSVIKSLELVDYEVINMPISIPTGEIVRCTKLFKDLPLKIEDCLFPSDFIELNLGVLDVILGMNRP